MVVCFGMVDCHVYLSLFLKREVLLELIKSPRCFGISLGTLVLNGIVHFCVPKYTANQWQTYLTYIAVSALSSAWTRECSLFGTGSLTNGSFNKVSQFF